MLGIIKPFENMFHDIAWESSWKRLICRVHLFHDGVHAISCSTHILIFSTMISTLYRGKNTRIIKVNPFHDDTTADEKYQFTCSVVFSATGPSWKGLISVTE